VIAFVRYAVFVVFMVAVAAAVASWLVRTRRVSPFSQLGRSLKSVSDRLVSPVERRLVRGGGNPVHAGMWLVAGVAVAGLLFITLLQWTTGFFQQAYGAFTGGFRPLYHFLVNASYSVLMIALFARVIGSWFGVFRYARWMRPAYVLTDWIVNPIRKFLPPLGALDVSPIVAWLALLVLRSILLTVVPV
jgi:YggT family protein